MQAYSAFMAVIRQAASGWERFPHLALAWHIEGARMPLLMRLSFFAKGWSGSQSFFARSRAGGLIYKLSSTD